MNIIRIYMVILLWAFSLSGVLAQSVLFLYNDKYRIELPNKLELQFSELNNVKYINTPGKKTHVKICSLSNRIVFQQKGLNDEVGSAFNKYCRVIIEYTEEDRYNPTFGRGDNITIDKDILYAVLESVKQDCARTGTPLIKLITVQGMNINGFPVLYYSYKRKGWEGKQPPVVVNYFCIFNRYESVTLAFSYRETERENWKDIHENIIKSFLFTNEY